jgi:hypothetical protein
MQKLTLWINAFIPKTVSGYTQILTVGPHTGKTAVPLPTVARTWPGNTFKDMNAGYLTDQRDFDPSPSASVRMQSLAEIDTTSFCLTRQEHRSSGTTEVNLVSGEETGFGVADMSRCSFTVVPSPPPPISIIAHTRVAKGPLVSPLGQNRSLELQLVGAAGDPLVGMAADIDYIMTFSFANQGSSGFTITFSGKIDEFPSYECYATCGNATKLLFKFNPPAGKTVANLLGAANRPIGGRASFP